MNKKEIEVITPADLYIKKSLADYPKETLKLFYDEESIAIDEKLYQVLKHKAIPLWVDRNYVEEKRRNTKNMEEALELIKEKCKKENINTRQEFNEKIAIHYNLEQIISGYLKILDNTRYGHFDEIQDEKIDFLKQIISIIDIEKEYKEILIDDIIDEYIEKDYYENREELINRFILKFPEIKEYLLNR